MVGMGKGESFPRSNRKSVAELEHEPRSPVFQFSALSHKMLLPPVTGTFLGIKCGYLVQGRIPIHSTFNTHEGAFPYPVLSS